MAEDTPNEEESGTSLARRGTVWMERIRSAEMRENNWREDAAAAERAYSADSSPDQATEGKVYDFNILHSNVETIVPAIYNSTPVPDIRRRRIEATEPAPKPPQQQEGQQPDPREVQQFQAAMQAYQQKTQADKDAKSYGDMLERAIAVQIDDSVLDAEIESVAQDSFTAGRGIVRIRFDADTDDEQITGEKITFEAVSWRDYREGPAKRWEDVPWIAFPVPMARETFDRIADQEMITSQPTEGNAAVDEGKEDDDVVVWEIWDKLNKVVWWVRESDGVVVKQEDDPLELPGFFPVPEPVQPISLTAKRTPVCPFKVYKKLADELDKTTKRINKIVDGMKVRGLIAGDASALIELASADDNEIRIEPNLEQLAQTGGLEKAIAWWPVETAARVVQVLLEQREATKASIYEITGISDIVRGASKASETLGAQQIKTQWGSLRIQKMQRLIERQIRDIFVMMSHVISTRFSPETLAQMTGIEMTEGVAALMQSPIDAGYRVDVESDSTVRADLTRQKSDMSEFMGATAQYFAAFAPVVQSSPEMAEPVAEIYASGARLFSLGKSAEDALERFVTMAKQAAENPPPNPAAEMAKAEMQMKQQELQGKAMLESEKLKIEQQRLQIDQAKASGEHGLRAQDLETKQATEGARIEMDRQKMAIDAAVRSEDIALRRAEKRLVERTGEDGSPEVLSEEAVISETLAQIQEGLALNQSLLLQGLEQIAALVSAPKQVELIRDETGRASGAIQRPLLN